MNYKLLWTAGLICIVYGVITKNYLLVLVASTISITVTIASLSIVPKVEERPGRYIEGFKKEALLFSQKGTCGHPNCPETNNLHLHHKVPLEYGGDNEMTNLIYYCPNHHAKAHEEIKRIVRAANVR